MFLAHNCLTRRQIFIHLIANAFQAMDERGAKLVLFTWLLNGSMEVKAKDEGIGIPQKYLNQGFDPVFTTQTPGEGTGLGLNVVYRIAGKHNGTINVEGKEQVETTFTINFPIGRRNHGKESIDRG